MPEVFFSSLLFAFTLVFRQCSEVTTAAGLFFLRKFENSSALNKFSSKHTVYKKSSSKSSLSLLLPLLGLLSGLLLTFSEQGRSDEYIREMCDK